MRKKLLDKPGAGIYNYFRPKITNKGEIQMKRILSVFAVLTALALLFGAFAPLAGAAINASDLAAEVVTLTNAERAKPANGSLPALAATNSKLNDAAMKRAEEISVRFEADHSRPDGRAWSTVLDDFGLFPFADYVTIGENIAWGQNVTAAKIIEGWMNSPLHRANILDEEFNYIGVGVYEASDGKVYYSQVFLGDGKGAATGAPAITTSALAGGTVGTPYSQTLAATGGAPITWSVSGGALPSGLSLSAAGVISGTPTASGTFSFTVKAENSAGNSTKALSIAVGTAPPITTVSLQDGAVGAAYSQTLMAGGTPPITWSVSGGALPPGLSLSAAGVISGTPTASGTFTFTVMAANAGGSDTKSLSITVNGAPKTYIAGTTREATIINLILYYVFFGWIWMR